MIKIDDLQFLQIGVQGENKARKFQFDMTSWVEELEADHVSGYTFGLVFKPYNSNNKYPLETTYDATTKVLTWQVGNNATQTPGVGYTEIRAQESTSGLVKKTRIVPTSVEESLSGNETTPPSPETEWVTNVLNAKTAAEAAQDAAEDAQEAAETARDAAQAAAGNFQDLSATVTGLDEGATPTVTVTHSSGGYYNLAFGIPKGDTGDPAPSDEVGPAVAAYLATVITNPDSPPLDRTLSYNTSAAPADMVGSLKSAVSNLVVTSSAELNKIIRRLYIPSSITADLTTINRITVFNGYSNLYGFRAYNSSNTKLLDFTKSSNFTGLAKVSNMIADIGDLTSIDGTSKNYYCTVNGSVKDQTQLVGEYNEFESDVKHRIAPEFSSSVAYNAGEYVWYNNSLQKFVKAHSAGSYDSSEMAAVSSGISYDLYNIAVMFALPYDATSTYAVGDYCTIQNKYLYRCKTAITTAETFNSSHWDRIFLTNVVKEVHGVIKYMAVSTNPMVNRIIKRLYIPSSASVDISTITRATFYNGFVASAGASPMYGYRLFAGNTKVVDFVVTNNSISGYETNSAGCYTEIGDLSLISGTSETLYCSIYPFVLDENGIITDYHESKNAKNNTAFGTYSPSAQASQGQNTGETVTVMSYNVAHYNNDESGVIIPDGKIHNIIKGISEINADFVCVQEDSEYIDSNNVRKAGEYLYYPQYPNSIAKSQCTVKSKKSADNNTSGTVVYSNGRWLSYGVFTIGTKKLLVCSTHPVANYNDTGTDSEDSIAARLTQYTELFKWIAGTIDLDDSVSGSAVHVPTHTHVVIGMDANTLTASDRTNLAGLASDYNCVMGNGGRIGWVKTARNRFEWYSLDNIIVSENIIINSFESMTEKYSDMYSDHVPVVAELTLLGS